MSNSKPSPAGKDLDDPGWSPKVGWHQERLECRACVLPYSALELGARSAPPQTHSRRSRIPLGIRRTSPVSMRTEVTGVSRPYIRAAPVRLHESTLSPVPPESPEAQSILKLLPGVGEPSLCTKLSSLPDKSMGAGEAITGYLGGPKQGPAYQDRLRHGHARANVSESHTRSFPRAGVRRRFVRIGTRDQGRGCPFCR